MLECTTIEVVLPFNIITRPFLVSDGVVSSSSISLFATTAKSSQPSDSTSPILVISHPKLSSSLPFISHQLVSEIPSKVPSLTKTWPELLIEFPGSLAAKSSIPSQLKSPTARAVPSIDSLLCPTRILSAKSPGPLVEP